MSETGEERWIRANLALACFLVDPSALGGIWLRARVGPVRERFLHGLTAGLDDSKPRRLHPAMGDDALFGGVDLTATLTQGAVIRTKGILEHSGVVILPMAERAQAGMVARLSGALDGDSDLVLVALDEGAGEDERLGHGLTDRLGIHLDLEGIAIGDAPDLEIDLPALKDARALLPKVTLPENAIAELARVAMQLGVISLRAPLLALNVARASAALSGETEVGQMDLQTAVELVLAPRATQFPSATEEKQDQETPPDTSPETAPNEEAKDQPEQEPDLPPIEILLEAAKAMLPPDLLARLSAARAARSAKSSSGSGSKKKGNHRGRPLPSRAGKIGDGARVDLVATLRAAAPWQKIRRDASGQHHRLHIHASDIRVRQYQETSERAIIFVVDASGSSAMARMAEAKGAIEILLAEAYSRRDHVALVAFRGMGAEVLLPPTRSLVQTKRRLSALAGGGGTPLAAGLKLAMELGDLARSKGMTPSVAVLTDGRANVCLAGEANRLAAAEDATAMARAIRIKAFSGLVIDTGARPTKGLGELAAEMGSPYLPLPRADARSLSAAVETALSV